MIVEPSRTSQDYSYIGHELDLFAHAIRWKKYFRVILAPYIRGRVLEVGAGLGETTRHLSDGQHESWTCLEPDAVLAERLLGAVGTLTLPRVWEVRVGNTQTLKTGEFFDTVLYIDVLEHIEDDVSALRSAAAHLASNGLLVILSPAFPLLFSPFDRALGHFRRYTSGTLAAAMPSTLTPRLSIYLDSVGFCASLANRICLRQSMPTLRQVEFWDRRIIPLSKVIDKAVCHAFGRSIVAIYQRCEQG